MKRRVPCFYNGDSILLRAPVLPCSRASPRDAIPLTLRLPRRCAPRNDTKIGTFLFENGRFLFLRLFLRLFFARCGSAPFFKRFVPKIVPFSIVSFRKLLRFPAKPISLVIARRARAPDAAIFNGTRRHPGTKYGCAGRIRTLEGREEAERRSESMFFVIGIPFCFVLPYARASCSRASPRDAIPLTLRLPRPLCGLAMTPNRGAFV